MSAVETLATLIVLVLMLVPGLNMLVGALQWGFYGFCIGAAINVAYLVLYMVVVVTDYAPRPVRKPTNKLADRATGIIKQLRRYGTWAPPPCKPFSMRQQQSLSICSPLSLRSLRVCLSLKVLRTMRRRHAQAGSGSRQTKRQASSSG